MGEGPALDGDSIGSLIDVLRPHGLSADVGDVYG